MSRSAIGQVFYALLAAVLVALAATFKTDGYVANILMQAATYAIAVFGLSIVLGLCGQINLAQAAFFALGAIASLLARSTIIHRFGSASSGAWLSLSRPAPGLAS
jgi:ABC-type branched-subunit amino acid transport system permease subunit